jgi:uncharacterized coiled-coil DUF342 family protein
MKGEDKVNILEESVRICFDEINEQLQKSIKDLKELCKRADKVNDRLVELETKIDLDLLEVQRLKADLLPVLKELKEEKDV